MNCKRLFFGVAVTMGTLIGAGTAAADPTGSPNSETLTLTCDAGLGETEIVTNGRGHWTPALITINNQILIPYSFDFEGTFTPHDGGPVEVAADGVAKKTPRNGRLATCTAHFEGSDEFGSFVFDLTVGVSYTPARGN